MWAALNTVDTLLTISTAPSLSVNPLVNTMQYMFFHCGMIPSILEWTVPSWNKSFQDGRNHSGFVPEFGYDSHPQNSSSMYVIMIWRIFFPISFYCRDILHLPWSDSLVWKESFQTGRNPSRLEGILPDWNQSFQSGIRMTSGWHQDDIRMTSG